MAKSKIEDQIMNWCWGKYGWDKNAPAHCFWKRQVKKYKKPLSWWRVNYKRIWEAD